MPEQVLITGGAGFIGSHLADELLAHGYQVRILDILTPQVHGALAARPSYLHQDVDLQIGDLRDPDAVRKAVSGVHAVFHLAAAVGVGQSMYQIARYTEANNLGTAVLLEALIAHPVRRLIVASSMSLYGEGLYATPSGRLVEDAERSIEQLRAGSWDLQDQDGEALIPRPTPETKAPSLQSVYALSKYDQERLCLLIGRAYGIPTVALRFFNVFGARQALSNPYTGVLAIFAARVLNDQPPLIHEDGLQRRDFVAVRDVARACLLALAEPRAVGEVFNVGSGHSYSIREIAQKVAAALGKERIAPQLTGKYRSGDIRHCFADITKAHAILGYQPRISLDEGLLDLASWLEGQRAIDGVAAAQAELSARGLLV